MVHGIYAAIQGSGDNGKLNSASISGTGRGTVYLKENIIHNDERVMFAYPINL